MDNKGTYHLNDNKMDANTVWKWRILHVKKYSRHPEPFHYSNEIGLDFNIACNTQKKLDLQLVTNGVILEVCDFAKTVSKNKRHYITNILKNNFSLGLENEQQRSNFAAQIQHKVSDLIRNPPEDKHEVFTLFDMSSKPGSTKNSNNVQKMLSTECETKSFLVEMDDTDDSEHEDELDCSEATSNEYIKTESLSDEMDRAHSGDSEQCSGVQSKRELKDASFPSSFPHCEEIGLNLDVDSKQSLDPSLLTKGVMLEVVHFTRALAASYSRIILDVLEHNFELDLKNQLVKNRVLFNISHLLKRRKQLSAIGSKITLEFKNEPFSFQTFARHHDKRELRTSEEQIQTQQILPNKADMKQKEKGAESSYSCAPWKSDLDPYDGTDSRNTGNEDHSEHSESCSLSSDFPKSESSCLGMHDTFLTSTDFSSSIPTVNSDVNSPFASQHDERGLCGGREQTPSPQNVLNKWDTEQEEMETENNMWKLRSNRVEQIVSSQNKEFCLFTWSKKLGLEFNVGFGPKQNISVDSLTNAIRLEIAKFAIAINSSQKEFIMEILEYNFDLDLQSQHQRNTFTREIMKRVRWLRCCDDAVKFSNEVFELPGPRPSLNMANQSEGNVIPQLSSVSSMEKCDVGFSRSADSHGESKEHIPHKSVDHHPFCKEICLKLHVNNSQPNRKLEINMLTNGAMTEVTNFAEKLCGTFEEIFLDILRHNFDLDSQSGDSDPAKNILAQINALVEQKNLSIYCATGRKGKKRGITSMDFKNNPNLDTCSPGSSQAAIMDRNEGSSTDIEHKKEINLKLWKVRTKQIQHILSMPHEEDCPLYSYSRCKKLGIDFNVGSGIKQNLDLKFLTNGIMAEFNAFASALLSSTKYFITEILEFNFNLDLKDELHRSVFAQKMMRKLEAIHCCKKGSETRWKMPFELPDMSCIQEPSFDRTTYCPRCYQERNHKIGQDESDAGHVHPCLQSMTDTVSAGENYSTKKPAKDTSSTFSATEETIMNSNPRCKKIGLTLCVDKDQPTDKLDTHFLTRGVMMEVENFAKRLCGTRFKILGDLLEHNFNISMQQTLFIDFVRIQHRVMAEEDDGLAYFDEVFVFRPPSQRELGHVSQIRAAALAIQRSDWRETIQQRKIALQTKEERATLPNPNKSVVKSKKNHGSKRNLYPICTEIGLDLDVTSQSEKKEKLDLKPLFASQSDEGGLCTAEAPTQTAQNVPCQCDVKQEEIKTENYYSCPIGESDIDSDAGADSQNTSNEDHLENPESCSLSSDNYRQLESSCMDVEASILPTTDVSSPLPSVNSKPIFASPPVEKGLSRSGEQTQIPRNAPNKCDLQQEGCQNNPDLEPCSAGSSQATIQDQNIGSYVANEHKNELNIKLWKVRANCIQRILSIPHEEDCPLYSYSRCKKLGIDFNVGSGVKQNLDPKFLTNGIMVELNTFASALLSSRKDFITEILEHNFNLDLKNELYRSAFGDETMKNIIALRHPKKACTGVRLKLPFELPEMRSIQEATYEKTKYCPRCYQDQSHKLRQNESDTDQMHYPCPDTMTDTVSAVVSYTAKKPAKDPSSTFSATEEMIMNSNPHCKKIGLTLCVDTDQPKNKLDTHVLTRGIILEVANFAKKLCGTIHKVINDVLEHNFNITMQSPDLNPSLMFKTVLKANYGRLTWLDEVFVIRPRSLRSPGYVSQIRAAALAIERSEWRETIQKRKLALQTKRKRSTLPNHNVPSECDMQQEEMRPENYYTRPLGESDIESDEGTDSENTGNEDHLKHPESCFVSSDLPKSESGCLGKHDTFLTSTDVSSSLPTVNSDVNSPFTSQRDERGLCGGGEQTPSLQSVLNNCDMEQEEMGTEINMWKLRSNRVEQIVSPLNKEFGQFHMSKRVGLEFNVGFGPKQNISIDSLTNSALLEIAKFAIAINSSQKEFIMEILEYNFDFNLQSQHQRNALTREIMKRVRRLRCCDDAVKFSNEVFELPGPRPSLNMANESEGSVIPQLSSISRLEKCDVGPSNPGDSHGESKEPIPHKSVDLYPLCKEIGLKLRVNNSQPNRKLEINMLTNGAMTEVTNFAEKLCGTFEEIFLDILRHNIDLDFQSGDSDPAKNILAQIPALVEQKNLSISCAKGRYGKKKSSTCMSFKNNLNLEPCSPGSSQAAIMDQNEGSSTDIEHKKEINLKLWKVRTKQIQHILSMPHEENCPLYSYSRCKKLGIDFNVGSGVKQNLDPKFLTNGIVAELNAFVVALLSSTKHFITEILEFNFNLDLKDELHRSAFAQEIMKRLPAIRGCKKGSETRWKMPFELPDMRCIQEPSFDRTTYCPRCYQERNHKIGQDESDAGHVHPCLQSMTDTVSADVSYAAKKPAKDTSSTFSATEETIMNSNPRCKKIGLTLCVDKDQPTVKLDTHVLTRGVMMEVENFAKKLCGTRFKSLCDLLEHNFNISIQQTRLIDFGKMHCRVMAEEDGGLAYFDEVFVFQPPSQREPGHAGQMRAAALAIQRSDWRETIQKRKIALQTKEERATLPNPNKSIVKPKKNQWSKGKLYPICTEIGLDLDVTSNSEEKEKLDLNLLTTAVLYEIYKFVTRQKGHYFPGILFDILDYNFDLSSQHHRRWEFAIATASKVQNTVKRYRQNREQADKVFKLPFVFALKKHTRYSPKESGKYIRPQQDLHLYSNEVTDSRNAGCQDHLQNPTSSDSPRESNSSCQVICAHLPTTAHIFLALPTVNSNVNPLFESQSDERGLCGGEEQTWFPRNVPTAWNLDQEEMRPENYYTCPLGDSDLDSDQDTDLGNTGNEDHLENPEKISLSSEIPPFASQLDKKWLCRSGEQTQISRNAPNECDLQQEGCQNNPNLEPCSAGSSQATIINQNAGRSVDNELSLKLWKLRTSVVKSKKNHGSKRNLYPICTEIGLDLDVTSQSEKKEKLDLKPLFASQSDEGGLCTAEVQTQTAQNVPCQFDVKPEIKTENYYSCPIGESDTESDAGADSQNTGNEDHLEDPESCSLSSDNYRQLESSCMDVEASILPTTDVSSPLPSVNSKPIFASPPVEKGLSRSGKQTQIPRNAPNKCDMEQEGCQNNPNLEPCSAGSFQATIQDQNIGSYVASEHKNELNIKLWKVRANCIQRILSIPHEEDCPLYSYSRCKKLGIDFNVGSGVKQNLDPIFLTNGIMVELNTFASALLSSRKDLVTEILEHNFNLDLKNELYRSAFADETMKNIIALRNPKKACTGVRLKLPFELPDMRSIQEATYEKTKYCPRCYQDQSHKLRQNESDTDQMHYPCPDTMTDTVSAVVSYTAKKPAKDPSSTFSATEEMIMNSNPHCKKIGLTLCVDTDQPKNKLDTHVLTRGIILEVANFAKKLCGTIHKVINDVLEHNFNITMQSPDLNPSLMFKNMMKSIDGRRTWLDEVFVIQPRPRRSPGHVGRMRAAALAIERSEWRETIQKRKLALQTKRKRATLPGPNKSVVKSKKNQWSKGKLYDEDSDKGTDSENTGNEDHSEHPESCSVSSDLPKSESSWLGKHDTFLTSTDVSSSLPTVNSDVNSPFTSQRDERGLCGGGEQTPSLQSVLNKWDTEQEEMGTEINMWKLRSNRVEQIVPSQNKEFGQFHISKKVGLEFNVGFGPKQNISVDSLTNSVLLEIAKFAIAINSSQKEFIMEILEYNFDFGLQSPNQRNTFTHEIMKRVRQLRCCDDAVKFSNEVFELPGPRPSLNMTNQSEGNVIPQLSSISRMEKCDVGPSNPGDSHGESKEPIPHKSVDLYPFCKEIGLKLRVNNSQPNRKLEINMLTNGAMTEVTNFAEKLCGTFEEIFLDILRHNFDLDLQSGDSDPAKNILAQIPLLVEQNNLSVHCANGSIGQNKGTTRLDFKNSPNLDTVSPGSSQAAIMDQNEGSSTDIEHKKEINLKLWKVRTKQIQHILSMPHEENCPLYSYSRCKKLGIDFNVGSGVKQNLDPKFLTNGIVAELNAFVVALLSFTKHFITEILEFNFNLDLKDELHRSAFAQEIMKRLPAIRGCKKGSETRWKMPFELPVMRCIQEPSFDKTTYCPRCYQERNHKIGQDESDAGHVHPCLQSMTDTVSADVSYTAKKPAKDTSSTFSSTEETIMNSNPRCKKIGLTLCVDKDQPTVKLDTHFLTCGVMMEVENFAKRLCGTRFKILGDLLEHNFNISMQQTRFIDFAKMRRRVMAEEDGGLAYFDEVFVFRPSSQREPGHVSQIRAAALAVQRSDWRETIQKRKIALQTKEERATLPNPNKSVVKSKKNQWSKGKLYPICTEIGLDLDVTSQSEEKEKLDLNLLTAAVVYEIHKFLTKKTRHYFPGTLFDILDYNFDLSSQHHRRFEFSIAAASKVLSMVRQYRQNRGLADKLLKLPFMCYPRASQSSVQKKGSMKRKRYSQDEPGKKRKKGRSLHQESCSLDVNPVNFLCGHEPNGEPSSNDKGTNYPTDPWMINAQSNQSPVTVDYGSPLPINILIKEEKYDPHYAVMKAEPVAEESYHPHYYNVKTESNSGDVGDLVPGESAGSLGCTHISMCPNTENAKTESENEGVQYYILAEPQGSQGHATLAVCPNTESNITTELDSLLPQYWVPGEVAASHGDSVIPVCQNNESTLIKEEQENMLIDSYN